VRCTHFSGGIEAWVFGSQRKGDKKCCDVESSWVRRAASASDELESEWLHKSAFT